MKQNIESYQNFFYLVKWCHALNPLENMVSGLLDDYTNYGNQSDGKKPGSRIGYVKK